MLIWPCSNSANVSSTAESDTMVSVASKAWSTDSNMTIKAALPIRNPSHQPPSVADSDTADEATKGKRTSEVNHQPPSVTDTTDTDRTDANTVDDAPKQTSRPAGASSLYPWRHDRPPTASRTISMP